MHGVTLAGPHRQLGDHRLVSTAMADSLAGVARNVASCRLHPFGLDQGGEEGTLLLPELSRKVMATNR